MFDLDGLNEIWGTISRNKGKSILTGLSVFWGIFMFVVMLGAGSGLQNGIMGGLDGFATNSCFFYTSTTSEPYMGLRKGRRWNLHNKDVDLLKRNVQELEYISPMLWGSNSTNNVVRNDRSGTYDVRGLYPSFTKIEQQRLRFGRFINDLDIHYKRKTCVLGKRVYEELFPGRGNPVGEYIRVNGIYYQVIGVAIGVSNISIGGNPDETVNIPFSTMQQVNNEGDVVHFLGATAKRGVDAKVLEEKIGAVLRENNRIAPTDKKAVGSFNIEEQFKMFDNLFLGIAAITWFVGLGTLLAGVIGVSNIMLISIRERTKEIGVRRALGAKPTTVLKQIIAESLLLTFLSGILGLCLGVGLVSLVDSAIQQTASDDVFFGNMIIAFNVAVGAMMILLFSGILAGALPAYRALQVKAIDAIREE
ncbi:MAG: ABC transporter permease [Bacteroidales bacterium]|nr:ABC transporter permease [Bacteroidales bacterium]